MLLIFSNCTGCQFPLFWIDICDLRHNFGASYMRLWTDGQSERVIQVLKDMLRCCVLSFEGNCEKYLPLVEFAYNNNC
ncbi:gag-pol [Gossypium australe]|uniref:Gag-pol n=1 Tax=Gossypium australe TaxID=47621 RepID=A0A5B6UZ34_9ROSI|nr:gag-pol [Gossypium australe]